MKLILIIIGSIIGLNVLAFGTMWIFYRIERRHYCEHSKSGHSDGSWVD